MTKTKFEVMEALNDVDVPCGPILSMKDIYEDKSLYERGLLVEIDHPDARPLRPGRLADQLSDSPVEVKRSPLLGEHTDEILGWLGYGAAEIENCTRMARCRPDAVRLKPPRLRMRGGFSPNVPSPPAECQSPPAGGEGLRLCMQL